MPSSWRTIIRIRKFRRSRDVRLPQLAQPRKIIWFAPRRISRRLYKCPPFLRIRKRRTRVKSDDSPVLYEREFLPRSVRLLCDGFPTIWLRRDRTERQRRLREFDSHLNEPAVTRI